jgi:hypothetical protein
MGPNTTPMAAATPQPITRSNGSSRLRGEVAYMFAFDIAYDMQRRSPRELLGKPVTPFSIDASKRSPKQMLFYRPQMVTLPPIERETHRGRVTIQRCVKIVPVGAISITMRLPFEVDSLGDLVHYHDLQFTDGRSLADDVRALGEEVRRELLPLLIKPVAQITDVEAYTVFCIEGPLRRLSRDEEVSVSAEQWWQAHRREVAALLTQETDAARLSEQEADESSSKYYSYYHDDIVVLDWDAAVVVDDPREFNESLYIMELANIQLAELEAYDQLLDEAVERAYRDLAGRRFARWRLGGVQRELRELRMDSARINDELSNITKFFGDWHLARLYQGLAARFHLDDWHRSVRNKLGALNEMYQLIHTDSTNRAMLFLEAAIVLLFVFEIVKSFL